MEKKENKVHSPSVAGIVQVALMAAIIFVTTYVIEIPVGTKAVLHIGDSMVFTGVVMLGKRKATIASAIGMGLFDLLSPYAIWSPFTFVIKGVMAYIAASIAYRKDYNGESLINNVFAFVIAGVWMIAGYYLAGGIIYGSLITALGDIFGNVIQVAAGIIIALPIIKALRITKFKIK